jgi:hypothetical protein
VETFWNSKEVARKKHDVDSEFYPRADRGSRGYHCSGRLLNREFSEHVKVENLVREDAGTLE